MDLNLKLQATSTKSLAKAIDFELRKEHAAEAEEQLNIVKVPPSDFFSHSGIPPRSIRIRTFLDSRPSPIQTSLIQSSHPSNIPNGTAYSHSRS